MDRYSLLRASYHAQKIQEHREELRQYRHQTPHSPEDDRELTQAERFDRAHEALKPFLIDDGSGRLRTPEVPIRGDVDGESVTVWLKFEASDEADVLYYAASSSDRRIDSASVGSRFIRRPDEAHSPLITDLEETVQAYLEAVELLPDDEKQSLGLPVSVS